MSIRKHNEFLEGDESDELSDRGYDSEALEESRGILTGRAAKRQRPEDVSDEASFDGLRDDGVDEDEATAETRQPPVEHDGETDQEGEAEDEPVAQRRPAKTLLRPSTPKDVAAAEKAARKSGVVYISRVPPFMKPSTLKHYLAPHAPKGLGRLFLTPEDQASRTRRTKNGGSRRKAFTDGWIEFVSKREAQIAAETLNGNIIGGKKGSFYHDDLWSMKYLKGFKWSHLTEQIASENAERAARLREEIRKTKEENKAFVQDIERGKMLNGMELKRKAKQKRAVAVGGKEERVRRDAPKEFKQKGVQPAPVDEPSDQKIQNIGRLVF